MLTQRFLLVHDAHRVLVPDGETLVGRALACGIRFNDPAVSREHLRIWVNGSNAIVTNLSSNGTLLNGVRLERPAALENGDELRIGHQRIRIEVVSEPDDDVEAPATELDRADEITIPGAPPTAPAHGTKPTAAPRERQITPRSMAPIQVHTCPRCRQRVSYFEDQCPKCSYVWPPGHPSHLTQEITVETMKERRSPRYAIEVPVIYSSATLTIDALVRDISKGGMFIATELLDPIGTPCELTALPNGRSALPFAGIVVHVAGEQGKRTSGLGIRFVGGEPEALEWLEQLLLRLEGTPDFTP